MGQQIMQMQGMGANQALPVVEQGSPTIAGMPATNAYAVTPASTVNVNLPPGTTPVLAPATVVQPSSGNNLFWLLLIIIIVLIVIGIAVAAQKKKKAAKVTGLA